MCTLLVVYRSYKYSVNITRAYQRKIEKVHEAITQYSYAINLFSYDNIFYSLTSQNLKRRSVSKYINSTLPV